MYQEQPRRNRPKEVGPSAHAIRTVRADNPGELGDIPAYNDASSQRAAERVEFHSIPSANE
jgi:hypothetical protein